MANKRIGGLDSLRFLMVCCVIALHAAMTFMEYNPEWWYVINFEKNIFFTYLVIILDSFPMSVLFFLAGYFALPSLEKRTKTKFVYDKFMHIGIPWIMGVLLVAPYFSRASLVSLGYPEIPMYEYFFTSFFGSLYQQAHYWFLGILFFFLIVFAWLFPTAKKDLPTAKNKLSPALIIAGIILISGIAYFLSTFYIKPADNWTNIGYVLYFQPARIISYILIFITGIYGKRNHWFEDNGWKPNLVIIFLFAVLSIFFLWYWKFVLALNLNSIQNQIIDAFSYSFVSVSMTFLLVSMFSNIKNKVIDIFSFFAPYSYGIYWLHQIILMLTLKVLVNFNWSPYIKWGLGIIITILICTLLTQHILKKVPFLKKIF